MALIIKNKEADYSSNPNAKRLYFDALTTNGTLLLLDFSRKSCVPNSLKKGSLVNDLANGGSKLNNDTIFDVTSIENNNFDFIENGSYLLRNTSSVNNGVGGINLGTEIQKYLKNNNVENAVFIFWIYQVESNFNGFPVITSTTSEDIGTKNIIRILIQTNGNAVITLGGTMTNPISISGSSDTHRQIAVVYKKGQPLTVYKSNQLHSYSSTNSGSWGTPNSDLVIGQRTGEDSNLSTSKIGRILIEDLDASGRTALDVINEDYEYVNGIGRYVGIEKRPFSNI